MLSLWIEFDLLSKHHFDQIQLFVDKMVVPADIGRIVYQPKLVQGFLVLKLINSKYGLRYIPFRHYITYYQQIILRLGATLAPLCVSMQASL